MQEERHEFYLTLRKDFSSMVKKSSKELGIWKMWYYFNFMYLFYFYYVIKRIGFLQDHNHIENTCFMLNN